MSGPDPGPVRARPGLGEQVGQVFFLSTLLWQSPGLGWGDLFVVLNTVTAAKGPGYPGPLARGWFWPFPYGVLACSQLRGTPSWSH